MNAYIYPTPEQMRQAVTRPGPASPIIRSLLDIFLDGVTHPIIPLQSPLPPIAPGICPAAHEAADTAFWWRFDRASERVDAERVRLKEKRRAEKKAAKARKKFTGKWVTHKGETLELNKMSTMHLFYAVRMIWNHSVPDYAQFDKFDNKSMKGYPDVNKWPLTYRRKAWHAMIAELTVRSWDDLSGEAYSQYKGMRALSRTINFK